MKLVYVLLYGSLYGCGSREVLIGIASNDTEVETIKNNYNEIHKNDHYGHVLEADGNCMFEVKDFDNKYLK